MANIESLSASWILTMLTMITYVSAVIKIANETSEHADLWIVDDMIIPRDLLRSGIVGTRYRWPNGTAPVEIDKSFNEKERHKIMKGLALITSKTCIKLPFRTDEKDYINIVRASLNVGCNSPVGRQGGGQTLNLEPSSPQNINTCIKPGTIAHETLHSLGFFHEHARHDRDTYIEINFANVKKGAAHNFDKLAFTQTYNVTYDFGSIMHYGAKSFAIDTKINTINTIPANQPIGQRIALSQGDIEKLSKMYDCCSTEADCNLLNTAKICNLITRKCKCMDDFNGTMNGASVVLAFTEIDEKCYSKIGSTCTWHVNTVFPSIPGFPSIVPQLKCEPKATCQSVPGQSKEFGTCQRGDGSEGGQEVGGGENNEGNFVGAEKIALIVTIAIIFVKYF